MIHPYAAAGSLLGGLSGVALGFVSKDLELTFQDALGNQASKSSSPSYSKTAVLEALKDGDFWKITLIGVVAGALLGEGASRVQSLALGLFT